MIVFERGGLTQFEFAFPAEQLDYDVVVVRVCDFFRLATAEVEHVGLACCLCVYADALESAVFDVSVEVVSGWEDNEGWTIECILFEGGDGEKMLEVEEQSESLG